MYFCSCLSHRCCCHISKTSVFFHFQSLFPLLFFAKKGDKTMNCVGFILLFYFVVFLHLYESIYPPQHYYVPKMYEESDHEDYVINIHHVCNYWYHL